MNANAIFSSHIHRAFPRWRFHLGQAHFHAIEFHGIEVHAFSRLRGLLKMPGLEMPVSKGAN
jgi:hypothetical protein